MTAGFKWKGIFIGVIIQQIHSVLFKTIKTSLTVKKQFQEIIGAQYHNITQH